MERRIKELRDQEHELRDSMQALVLQLALVTEELMKLEMMRLTAVRPEKAELLAK